MERADSGLIPASFSIFFLLALLTFIFLQRRQVWLVTVAGFLVIFLLGTLFLRFHLQDISDHNRPLLNLSNKTGHHIIAGQIISAPVPYDEGTKFIVEAAKLHLPSGEKGITGRLALTVKGVGWKSLEPGDWVRFKASLRPVRNFKAPGVFDAETWWMIKGVTVKGFVNGPLRIVAVSSHSFLSCPVEKMRKRLMEAIDGSFSDPEAKGMALAMLTGEKAWLSKNLREVFSRTGASHLLAVSGLHMAMVAFFTGGLFYRIMRLSSSLPLRINIKKTAISLGLVGALFYAFLTGFSPSSTRAVIMTFAIGSAFLINRPQTSINSLAIAAFIILCINPMDLFSVSFQLSFTAVFFIIIFCLSALKSFQGKKEEAKIKEEKITYTNAVKALLFTTIAASLATAPIIALYFYRVSLVAIPVNLFMTPFVSLLVLPGFILGAIFLPASGGLAHIVWQVTEVILSPSIEFLKILSKEPWTALTLAPPSFIGLTAMYSMLLVCAFFFSRRWIRYTAVITFLFVLFVPVGKVIPIFSDSGVKMHVIDVGQGSSQVIELPGRQAILVDAGRYMNEDYDMGNMVVGPFLKSLGYTELAMVVATHPEMDHIGGLPSILKDFKVKELITNEDAPKTSIWKRLMEASSLNGARHTIVRERKVITMGDAVVEVWPHTGCKGTNDKNSRSLVVILRYQGKTIALTGDIDKNRERCLLSQGIPEVDALVVPHHGSNTSSSMDFIKRTSPEVAVIPVGWRNSFGLPGKNVIKRYEKEKARLLRTDADGTVTLHIIDGRLTYETFMDKN